MKALPFAGGVFDQPADLVKDLAWFVPKYDMMKFTAKVDMILGGDPQKASQSGASLAKHLPSRDRQFRR